MEDPTNFVKPEEAERHAKERAENGFSVFDWWNFDSYLTWVIIGGLEKFKTGAGHPVYGGVNSEEDWVKTLDLMIEGFQARHELDNDSDYPAKDEDRREWHETREEKWRVGSELFIKFFPSLWD